MTEILTISNAYDDRVKFAYELENNNSISFLYILIIENEENIETDWYTKPTFSGRFLNFNSQHPTSQKIAMVYNLDNETINYLIKIPSKKIS